MPFTIEKKGDCNVVSISGKFSEHGEEGAMLVSAVRNCITIGEARIIVNFAQCTRLNDPGLGHIVHSFTITKSAGGHFALCEASEGILSLLRITRLASIFEHFATEADAVATLSQRPFDKGPAPS